MRAHQRKIVAGHFAAKLVMPGRSSLPCADCVNLSAMPGIHILAASQAQHDRLAVEAADPEIVRDLPDHLEHGGLAAARAGKWKHVDRAVDRPIDVLVDQGFEVFKLAFVDRAMHSARKTPETVLCHDA